MALNLPPDPYKILGVTKDSTLPEIRSAHRKLVLKCHPDKVQDAALKAIKQDEFQRVQQAYELLSDDNRRLQYNEQVKLFELRKEMGRGVPTARSNPFEYEVRDAEPRPSTYSRPKPAPPPQPNVYSHQPPPRSYEDVMYEEPLRTAKKSASYESTERRRPSTREQERERDSRKQS
jgi:curved DNA-binding protein CbpA